MKKILIASLLAAGAFAACTPKATPTSSTPASSSSSSSSSANTPPPAPPAAIASNATAVEAGHQIYTAKCGRCHGLKEPSNYTAERWEPILKSMAPKARLSDEETANVRAYVQANAKKA